jgi:hypothetical protein
LKRCRQSQLSRKVVLVGIVQAARLFSTCIEQPAAQVQAWNKRVGTL